MRQQHEHHDCTVVFMDGGVIAESGRLADVLDKAHHARTRAFLSKVLSLH